MEENTLSNDFLRYVSKNEQNPSYRQMAKELLEYRKKHIPEMIYSQNESSYASSNPMCDDCDLTLPCCHKCIGA
jgi:hypothetical protein